MDLLKQYIVQSISAASNNLRLNPPKIEVVALLREAITKSEDLENDIRRMKTITELSTLAIRLNEIYNYLTHGQVDLFKLSDKFKEHSQYLIRDLSHMLDMVNPITFKEALNKINVTDNKSFALDKENNVDKTETIEVNLTSNDEKVKKTNEIVEDKTKEEIILEEEKEDDSVFFQNYETAILKPIKAVDSLLKKLSNNDINPEELIEYSKIMKTNGQLSSKIGFDIIAGMHKIISKALLLIRARELMPGKEVIESIRACLIVIVAMVRDKEVDITNYLSRAETFGKSIQTLKLEE